VAVVGARYPALLLHDTEETVRDVGILPEWWQWKREGKTKIRGRTACRRL